MHITEKVFRREALSDGLISAHTMSSVSSDDESMHEGSSEASTGHQPSPAPVLQVDKTFAQLGVDQFLCKALQAMSIRKPTEVQAACIPHILRGASMFAIINAQRSSLLILGRHTFFLGQAPTASDQRKQVQERRSPSLCQYCRHSPRTLTACLPSC